MLDDANQMQAPDYTQFTWAFWNVLRACGIFVSFSSENIATTATFDQL